MNSIWSVFLISLALASATRADSSGSSPDAAAASGTIGENQAFWQIIPVFSGAADPPPEIKTYQLPRFDGQPRGDHHSPVQPLKLAPAIDYDALYQATLNCYPEKSKFGLEIELEGAFKNRTTYDYTGSEVGQYYAGVVARIPLYSATEMNREREREYKRRTETAATIGAFLQAIATRNHALRELGLYQSLEARSQLRVLQGVAPTSEQVQYLERVARAQKNLIKAESAIAQHRLGLIANCADDKSQLLGDYLKQISRVPGAVSPPDNQTGPS